MEKVIEKLEIMSAVTMKNKRFKAKAEERLAKLEAAQLQNVQKVQFENDMEKAESRITIFTRETLVNF